MLGEGRATPAQSLLIGKTDRVPIPMEGSTHTSIYKSLENKQTALTTEQILLRRRQLGRVYQLYNKAASTQISINLGGCVTTSKKEYRTL